MVFHTDSATPGYWRLPGIEIPDSEEPMACKPNIRSLLLQPRFCKDGKNASHRDRFEANLRAIFGSLLYFYDCKDLGEDFWTGFAHRLCPYWDGHNLKEVVLLYAKARERYFEKHSRFEPSGHMSSGVKKILQLIDGYISRCIIAAPTQPSIDLHRTFKEKLRKWDHSPHMTHARKPSDSRDTNLSIKGLAARSDSSPSKHYTDQNRPEGPPRGPAISTREVSLRHEDPGSNRSPSLASRISVPSKPGSFSMISPDKEVHSPSTTSTRESPHNALKRAASFSVDSGSSKRRAGDADSSTSPTVKQRVQTEIKPKDALGPVNPPRHLPDHIKVVNTTMSDDKPESPKAGVEQSPLKHRDTVKQSETTRQPETATQSGMVTQPGTVKMLEPVKQPETERVDKIEAQLKSIGELLNKRFSGIEAQVVAIQNQVSQNAVLSVDAAQTSPSPQRLPPPHYLDEYLKCRDHNVLLEGVSDEIHKIKRYLLYGLRDHEHNQTSDAWKIMEGVWAALDDAERRASGSS